jgi:hypothetical protein
MTPAILIANVLIDRLRVSSPRLDRATEIVPEGKKTYVKARARDAYIPLIPGCLYSSSRRNASQDRDRTMASKNPPNQPQRKDTDKKQQMDQDDQRQAGQRQQGQDDQQKGRQRQQGDQNPQNQRPQQR